jgi:hypothetical protein
MLPIGPGKWDDVQATVVHMEFIHIVGLALQDKKNCLLGPWCERFLEESLPGGFIERFSLSFTDVLFKGIGAYSLSQEFQGAYDGWCEPFIGMP